MLPPRIFILFRDRVPVIYGVPVVAVVSCNTESVVGAYAIQNLGSPILDIWLDFFLGGGILQVLDRESDPFAAIGLQ